MTKKIDISNYESELIILERIHYEVTGRENILNFMINNDDNDKPQYKKIWKEYLEYLKTYNSIKQSFFNNYIYKNLDNNNNNKITWTIDFDKKEVIING